MAPKANDGTQAPVASLAPPPTMASPTSAKQTNGKKTDGETPGLATLPEELVSNIAVKLGSDDIFSLRLTCRDLEAKCLHEFATEYFVRKGFIFTSEV